MHGQTSNPLSEPDRPRGLLGWFAGNHVAANCLMVLIVGAGIVAMLRMPLEVFPEVDPDLVTVTVPYPGATSADVEDGIIRRIEDRVTGIEGVAKVRSVAAEGVGTVMIEVQPHASDQRVLDDVKAEVDRIDAFPELADPPIVELATTRVQVMSVAIYGDASESTLRHLAERVKDDLMLQADVTEVELSGVREFEVWVEVDEAALRKYGLALSDVADVVRNASLDLPAGKLVTEGGEVLIRTVGQRYKAAEFADIVLLTRANGTMVRLGDVAEVRETFEDTETAAFFDGEPAVRIEVFRVGDQSALEVSEAVRAYVERQQSQLPEGVKLAVWLDRSQELADRIAMLSTNGALGLLLVLACLALFLDLRLAFWTTLGIPISFLGGFVIMMAAGVTVNMMSLFAMIVALGIVVDDAIVVGENVFAYRQRGYGPVAAAAAAVREMAAPVTIAVLTTIFAFAPMLYTRGDAGKVLWPIAAVVIAVLTVSLVEALFVLPAHLATSRGSERRGPIARLQAFIRRQLQRVIDGPYQRLVAAAVSYRYATVALAVAILLVVGGLVAGGHVKFAFLPSFDAYYVWSTIRVPPGTPPEHVRQIVQEVEQSARVVADEWQVHGRITRSPIRHISTNIGAQPIDAFTQAGPWSVALGGEGSHLAEVTVELTTSDLSEVSASEFAEMWRRRVGPMPGGVQLGFHADLFSVGEPVFVELRHHDHDRLLEAAERLKARLGQFVGVTDISDSYEPGKSELELSLTDEGRTTGLTQQQLAAQVRNAFHGAEAEKVQRGRHEVTVRVRYPEHGSISEQQLRAMRLRMPDGTAMAFDAVAEVRPVRGVLQIERADRERVVNVTADVDPELTNANAVNARLRDRVLPQLANELPGLRYRFEGEQAEQAQTLSSLGINFALAILVIFTLLATQFRSYVQPLIVMTAIPFGLVGAVVGHAVMGYQLSMLSIFGVVALAGVVVNDSLILVDAVNHARRAGTPALEALKLAGMKRFRPILLTTLTTFLGLTPMIFETSFQGRFLVPMAISLGYGILFATAITLLLVPALYMIVEDMRMPRARRLEPVSAPSEAEPGVAPA